MAADKNAKVITQTPALLKNNSEYKKVKIKLKIPNHLDDNTLKINFNGLFFSSLYFISCIIQKGVEAPVVTRTLLQPSTFTSLICEEFSI